MELLVVGLDLVTGRPVHVSDRRTEDWHAKGHNGDRTLVCALCYQGADLPGGPRTVALVPRGRLNGARRPHFAHPPGMAPPAGRHSPETMWHATAKHRLCLWAVAQGAAARAEAWTPGRARRSDVAITLPGGGQVALEVQLGPLTDAAWLARHHDYAAAGITDVWLWHQATWIPRVMFEHGQPGWILDLNNTQLGLVHASPGAPAASGEPGRAGCGAVHWPPCPGDQVAIVWMPLNSAHLTPQGIRPSAETLAEITRQSDAHARRQRPRQPSAPVRPQPRPASPPLPPARTSRQPAARQAGQDPGTHYAFKYESRPPDTNPDTWRHYCDTCGRTLTLAELKSSPIIHLVPAAAQAAPHGIQYQRYGGPAGTGEPRTQAPATTCNRRHGAARPGQPE